VDVYAKPKANAATPKTVTIAKQTILPDRPDHDKPLYMGQFQWGPGTQEGSHRHPMTTANKFSALSTEDDEDTEIDETRGQPGVDRDPTLVPDGTVPTMGVVPLQGWLYKTYTRPTLIPGDGNYTSSTERLPAV